MSRAIHVVRHAKAKNRLEWTAPDELRPLTGRGRREAAALAGVLAGGSPERLVSSPYLRCTATLEPLAEALDLPIETTELLAEGADGDAALDLLLSVSASGPIVSCTHGDVLYDVMRVVAASGLALAGPMDVPVASRWTLEVDDGRVIAAVFAERPTS